MPVFDPNKPYEVVKPQFDPGKPFELVHDTPNQAQSDSWMPSLSQSGAIAGGIGGAALGSSVGGPPGGVLGGLIGAGVGSYYPDIVSLVKGEKTRPRGQQAKESMEAIGGEIFGQGLGAGASLLKEPIKEGARAAGKFAMTKLYKFPEEAIEQYATQANKIEALIKKYPNAEAMANASADLKVKVFNGLKAAKDGAGRALDSALAQSRYSENMIRTKPIMESIDGMIEKLNPKTQAKDIGDLNSLKKTLKSLSSKGGESGKREISVKNLNDFKKYVYEFSSGSYQKSGQIVQTGSTAQKLAKGIAGQAKNIMNEAAPEIKQANNTFHKIYEIDRRLPRSTFNADVSSRSLERIASGIEPGRKTMLQEAGKISGVNDVVNEIKNIKAARGFQAASNEPFSVLGTSRALGMPALGYAVGGTPGMLAGMALQSPAVGRRMLTWAPKAGEALAPIGKLAGQAGSRFVGEELTPTPGFLENMQDNFTRPIVHNPDGSFSTEKTITVSFDTPQGRRHFVIPTIINGKQVSNDEAIEAFKNGSNPAVIRPNGFDSANEANHYAKKRSKEIGKARSAEAEAEKNKK